MQFDPKLGHDVCAICRIPCACAECKSILDQPWIRGLTPQQQPRFQPVIEFTYWQVIGSFNNWNTITLSHKATTNEAFEVIYQVVLDGIGDNIASLVQSVKYGDMNTTETSKFRYYVIKFVSEAYTLKDETTCNRVN